MKSREKLFIYINQIHLTISKANYKYLKNTVIEFDKIPTFYYLPKIDKMKTSIFTIEKLILF